MARYSAVSMDHFQSPRNVGMLDDYDIEGSATLPGQSPFVRLYLKVEGSIIARATFVTFGCAAATAAGSMLTELIKGRDTRDCARISAGELDQALGGLPEERRFCADLAIAALKNALHQIGVIR